MRLPSLLSAHTSTTATRTSAATPDSSDFHRSPLTFSNSERIGTATTPADEVLRTLALPALSITDQLHYQRILCTGALSRPHTRAPLKNLRSPAALRNALETLARKLTTIITARAAAANAPRRHFASPTSAQTRALNTEVLRFASILIHLNGIPPLKTALTLAPRANLPAYVQDLWQRRNLLVTPAHLLYCDTLETIGYVKLPR